MHGVHQFGAAGDCGQRQPAGDALGSGDQVGHYAFVVAGEPVTGAAEAALNLVGDEHSAVVAAPLRKPWQKAVRWHDEATLALNRFDDHRRHLVLAHLHVHQRFELSERLVRDVLGIARPAVGVGHRHAVDVGREGPEPMLVGHVFGGERHGQVGAAVVGVVEAHHGGASGGHARDLDGVLDRLGARVEQGRLLGVIARGEFGELFGHLDVALVRGDHEAGVGELLHCLVHASHDSRRSVADRCHGDARAEVDQVVAVGVDQNAAAGFDDVGRQGGRDAVGDAGLLTARQLE